MAEGVMVSVGEPSRAEEGKVSFTGTRGPLLLLLLKNALLTLLTAGIYRFWAKTALRRWYWGHVVLEGAPLEYTGRGIELFLGFLIAMAILFGVFFVLGLATAGLTALSPLLGLVMNGVVALVFLGLMQVALFRAWRYRLSRTIWCGIRFALDGSSKEVLKLAMIMAAATVASAGLLFPWMRVALLKYRIDNMRFGDLRFSFAGEAKALLLPWMAAWGPIALLFLMPALFAGALPDIQVGPHGAPELPPAFGGMAFLLVGAAALGNVYYRVQEFRYVAARTSFGDAGFESDLRAGSLLLAVFLVGLVLIGVVLLAMIPLIMGAMAMGPAALPLAGLLVIVVVLPLQFIAGGLISYEVIRRVCSTLTVKRAAAFHGAAQAADQDIKRGEGLADALDVDAF